MRFMKPYKLFHELVKSNALVSSRIVGLDVRDTHVGVALSDATNKVASPCRVIVRPDTTIDVIAEDLRNVVSDSSLGGLVFGYQYDRQKCSRDGEQVKLFVDDLLRTGKLEGVNYTYWDGCFTSENVELLLQNARLSFPMQKRMSDKFAAVGMLQGYLDYVNRKKTREDSC